MTLALRDFALLRCTHCGASAFHVLATTTGTGATSATDHQQTLQCSACKVQVPVIDGVLRFVPAENYAGSFGYQWNRHRATQLDSFTGLPLSRDRLFAAAKWPDKMPGQTILEAGSGAGRFTEVLAQTGAEVYTFDLSSAVTANHENNHRFANVRFAQGDILNAPFRYDAFDKVICLGVIQHTPDPRAAFLSLARHVRPGGSIVIDCYARNLKSLAHWKYLLRPITRRMDKQRLHGIIEKLTPPLVPLSAALRDLFGPAGARLLPILQYRHWGLSPELNRHWAILDTFDMYSPAYDRPQTLATVRRWYEECGLVDSDVRYGPNGVVASGNRPG